MAAGNWVPELIKFGGGQNVFGGAVKHSPWLDWEAVCDHGDPESCSRRLAASTSREHAPKQRRWAADLAGKAPAP